MRRLLVLPIVHSRSDLGSLQTVAAQAKVAALGERRTANATKDIDDFWLCLGQALASMQLDYSQVLVYQDGLPRVQNVALQIERQIVDDLAKAGSLNHQLVRSMLEQGAALVGTESPDLLMQEYHAIRRSLTQGYRPETSATSSEVATDTQPTLMQQRDRFIAQRVDETLGNEQLGLLFIGMLHRVEDYLPDDIQVEYPVGRPATSAARFIDRPATDSILTENI